MRKSKQRLSKGDRVFTIFVNVITVFILILVLYPLYFVIIASISNPELVNSGKVILLPQDITFVGYQQIFKDSRIWSGYLNTFLYTSCGTILALILTIGGGYSLSRKSLPGGPLIMKLLVFTMYFQGGLIPTYMIVKNLGLVDTRWVLIILGSFSVYNLIIARTFFANTLPAELYEAASIDGCGNAKFFFSIALPLSKAVIAVTALYYAVFHWNSFFNALIYVNDQSLYPLQLILRDILISSKMLTTGSVDFESLLEMQKIADTIKYGVIIVSSLPILIFYPFVQKYFVKGVMVGAVKG